MGPAACVFVAILLAGCGGTNYRVERLDGSKATNVPLKFASVSGARSGDTVLAQIRFADGSDNIQINLTLHLAPAAECTSANYHAAIGGQDNDGLVRCESLAFQGGQDSPSVGGVFLLQDSNGTAKYRVSMPSTQIQRRFAP